MVKILQSTLDKNTAKRDKLLELDYMRFIACFAVMIVHITATGVTDYVRGSTPYVLSLILNRSLKFTTPVFVFLSGVTGFYGYRNKEIEYVPFIIKRLKKVVIPYAVWCVVYYLVFIKLGYYALDLKFFIKSFFLGNMSYHLYFVIIITQLYLAGPLLYGIMKKCGRRIPLLVLSAVITALCVEYIRFNMSDRIFLKYMFFYMLGMYVTLEYNKFTGWIERHKGLTLAGYVFFAVLYTVASHYDMKIYTYAWFAFSFASILFAYCIGLSFKSRLVKLYGFIKLFGQSSYYIYLMHPLILTLMIIETANRGILSVTLRIILYFAVVIPVTVISCLLYTKVKNIVKDKIKGAASASNL